MLSTYELATKIIETIARHPENRNADGSVIWDYVEADMFMDYNWMTNEKFNDAVDFILEAAKDLTPARVLH